VRPNCSPPAFVTPLFLAGTCPRPIAPDPKDSYLLSLAEASEAELLVTGDEELLFLTQHKSTRIITPAAMIELLKEAESGEQRRTSEAMAKLS
jgi:hypothetical protein